MRGPRGGGSVLCVVLGERGVSYECSDGVGGGLMSDSSGGGPPGISPSGCRLI